MSYGLQGFELIDLNEANPSVINGLSVSQPTTIILSYLPCSMISLAMIRADTPEIQALETINGKFESHKYVCSFNAVVPKNASSGTGQTLSSNLLILPFVVDKMTKSLWSFTSN